MNMISQKFFSNYCKCLEISLSLRNVSSTTHLVKTTKPFKSIPGPSVLSLILGKLPGGKYVGLEQPEMLKMFAEQYGRIFSVPGMINVKTLTVITDPNDIEHVFRTEGIWPIRESFPSVKYYREVLHPEKFNHLLGTIVDNGESWYKLRSTINPIMLKHTIVNQYIPEMDSIAADFCNRIKILRDVKNEMPCDFYSEIKKWSIESISSVGMNTRLNLLRNSQDKAMAFQKSFKDFIELAYQLDNQPSLHNYITTPKYKKFIKSFDTLSDIAIMYVNNAIAEIKKHPSADREPSILEHLLKVNEDYAIVVVLDILTAGVDTASTSSANLLYCLAKNPQKQNKLREEINSLPLDKNGVLTPTSFQNIPYLRACYKESLRVLPTAPGIIRSAGQDLQIDGYHVPKGTDLLLMVSLMDKDERFCMNANTYLPERWLKDADPRLTIKHPFVYLPFGFGTRACIGRRLVEMETFSLMARLLKNFRIEFDYGPLEYKMSFIQEPISDLKFKFIDI